MRARSHTLLLLVLAGCDAAPPPSARPLPEAAPAPAVVAPAPAVVRPTSTLDSSQAAERPSASQGDTLGVYVTPAAIPGLPATIRSALEAMGCLVPRGHSEAVPTPQAFAASLYEVGPPRDWAVACSRADGDTRQTTVFAFPARRGFVRDSVMWLGQDETRPGGADEDGPRPPRATESYIYAANFDSSTTLGQEYPEAHQGAEELTAWERARPMHDGIMNFAGASSLLYWTGKRWVELPGAD